jgi:tetratricopeptide (TPR) repeat protein
VAALFAAIFRTLTDDVTRRLALFITAIVNLCDCVNAWSKNVEEQQAVGEAALERYLRQDPYSPRMLGLKATLFALRGRYEESLLVADAMLKRDPESLNAHGTRAYDLLKLGRPQDALSALNEYRERGGADDSLAAAIHYQLAQFEPSAQMARKAITELDKDSLGNPRLGAVALTLVAAEARMGRLSLAKVALADFNAAVPGVATISAIRKWMHPGAELAVHEPLFEGLRLAGVPV